MHAQRGCGPYSEVATGRQEPTQSKLMSVGLKGLIVDPVCKFLVGQAGERKSTDSINRRKRQDRWWHGRKG